MQPQSLVVFRDQIAGISLGTVFLIIGVAASAMAAVRSVGRTRFLFLWQGVFAALYGARLILMATPLVLSVLPQSAWRYRPYAISIITYLIVIPALLFWLVLSQGRLRNILRVTCAAAMVVDGAGVGSDLVIGIPGGFTPWSNLLNIWILLVLVVVNASPALARRFLTIQSPIASVGVLISASAAIYTNLQGIMHLRPEPALEPLAMAVFFLSLMWVAAANLIADQRRLLSVEKELAIAREIQSSILPNDSPGLEGLRISAVYRPMTAVAGDFYEFVPIDQYQIGFLMADVSGHGVPAALIAAMIKVAMQSASSFANNPGAVLRSLNRSLSGQLRGQFVSACFLLIDVRSGNASYSAAGHPPLLLWREGILERIESNGIVIGVITNPDYPVREFSIHPGDRVIIYTDGVIEPENTRGESFGDHRLEQVIRSNQERPPSEFLDKLLEEIRLWQPASLPQQDDISILAVDIVSTFRRKTTDGLREN